MAPASLMGRVQSIASMVFVRFASGDDGRLIVDRQLMERSFADVRSGAMRLFYVDPSLGAEIGVICKSHIDTTSTA
ncbi:MAG: hypothetical protein JSR91_10995 [Proteobacteria bacterium]|nr:hypothetical protein [Pseudomonadota bacterium]